MKLTLFQNEDPFFPLRSLHLMNSMTLGNLVETLNESGKSTVAESDWRKGTANTPPIASAKSCGFSSARVISEM
jgi:hypothetical protein